MDLVQNIENYISDDFLDDFWQRLAETGYRRDHESHYGQNRFECNDPEFFLVDRNFPKLTPDSFAGPIDLRIFGISYSIELSGISHVDLDNSRLEQDIDSLLVES